MYVQKLVLKNNNKQMRTTKLHLNFTFVFIDF